MRYCRIEVGAGLLKTMEEIREALGDNIEDEREWRVEEIMKENQMSTEGISCSELCGVSLLLGLDCGKLETGRYN